MTGVPQAEPNGAAADVGADEPGAPAAGRAARGRPAAGPRGAALVGAVSLALVGGLWLAARGAPSAGHDPTPPAPTPTVSTEDRFGFDVFPTARAVIRRQPVRLLPAAEERAEPMPTAPAGR